MEAKHKVQGGGIANKRKKFLRFMQQVFINAILEHSAQASIAQLGERQTEDLKVPRSIRGRGIS